MLRDLPAAVLEVERGRTARIIAASDRAEELLGRSLPSFVDRGAEQTSIARVLRQVVRLVGLVQDDPPAVRFWDLFERYGFALDTATEHSQPPSIQRLKLEEDPCASSSPRADDGERGSRRRVASGASSHGLVLAAADAYQSAEVTRTLAARRHRSAWAARSARRRASESRSSPSHPTSGPSSYARACLRTRTALAIGARLASAGARCHPGARSRDACRRARRRRRWAGRVQSCGSYEGPGNTRAYLTDVVLRASGHPARNNEELLPHGWQPAACG